MCLSKPVFCNVFACYFKFRYSENNCIHTVKPVFSGHSKRRQKLIFKTNYRLMQVKSIAECSKRVSIILRYLRPSLSYHLSLRSLFFLFLSGCLRQVLLYKCFIYLRPLIVQWLSGRVLEPISDSISWGILSQISNFIPIRPCSLQ